MAMQKINKTEILSESIMSIRKASKILNQNELVAFPTETVYGLGASAASNTGVAKIFAVKGRPKYNPLIIHIAKKQDIFKWAEVPKEVETLIETFWPGPLTLVLKQKKTQKPPLASLITSNLRTIAIRVPSHETARRLIKEFGYPIAAPSANISGRISPTRAKDVLLNMRGKIAAVIKGDNCVIGLESTIINFSTSEPVVLRPGGVTIEEIEKKLGRRLLKLSSPENGSEIIAPGMMKSHYAPKCKLNLNIKTPNASELFLGFGEMPKGSLGLNLSQNGSLEEAAANLFAALTDIDEMATLMKLHTISVAPIPNVGLGIAINDRLKRAAAPKN